MKELAFFASREEGIHKLWWCGNDDKTGGVVYW